MSTLEANLELLSTIPEEYQEEIQHFLITNFCSENPYKPLSKNGIKLGLFNGMKYIAEGRDIDECNNEIAELFGVNESESYKIKSVGCSMK